MEFAIVDIETTGGSPASGGITEIAVVIHDGEKITGEYQTLINPQQAIPHYITGLTGIDQAMVQDAPTFSEISEELWDLLENRVFVAHQVNFDFGFIRTAFLKEGKNMTNAKLCTVRLARKAFPGLPSYSLGRICENQRIPILARHRAMGDAKATAILFDRMINQQPEVVYSSLKKRVGESYLPPNFSPARFREIPEACGVYYMMNSSGKVIYVGKANNIKERFKGHFSGNILPHIKQQLKAETMDLRWQLTGSEMMALLLEALEIKKLWPKYNSALKLPKTLWGIFDYQDSSGYLRFQVAKVSKNLRPLETFFSSEEALGFLKSGIENFQLCKKLSGLRKVTCETVQDEICQGACKSQEEPKSYNVRAKEFISLIRKSKLDLILELPGREEEEKAICYFENGMLSRFGFIQDWAGDINSLEVVPKVPETFYVLRQFLPKLNQDSIRVLEGEEIPAKSEQQLGLGWNW
ncbi:exonuclease domain-containing protein [Algoriphagus taiwanensis]|uniref:Exonuclease domain-containing protein n=1 Tax=Algoriphagus taiwanensis TaxID=1445656 RepID=A0ABQ6Q678_9BACT|nr:exonuclease domain-containing protein [Algoriphagus taiwanensis]